MIKKLSKLQVNDKISLPLKIYPKCGDEKIKHRYFPVLTVNVDEQHSNYIHFKILLDKFPKLDKFEAYQGSMNICCLIDQEAEVL